MANRMYLKTFLLVGVVLPIGLHLIASDRMPWWPDTVTTGIGFGVAAVAILWKVRADREPNSRLWNALKEWGAAIGRHLGSR